MTTNIYASKTSTTILCMLISFFSLVSCSEIEDWEDRVEEWEIIIADASALVDTALGKHDTSCSGLFSDPGKPTAYYVTPTLWPNAEIHYSFETEIPEHLRAKIRDLMDLYELNTPIHFTETEDIHPRVLIRYTSTGNSSSATEGYRYSENYIIFRGENIYYTTILHELGHIVGLIHPHTRLDSHDFVQIHWENIQTHALSNFSAQEAAYDLDDFPYDKYSFMNYETMSFSCSGAITLDFYEGAVPTDPIEPFDYSGDWAKITSMYSN